MNEAQDLLEAPSDAAQMHSMLAESERMIAEAEEMTKLVEARETEIIALLASLYFMNDPGMKKRFDEACEWSDKLDELIIEVDALIIAEHGTTTGIGIGTGSQDMKVAGIITIVE